MYSDDINELEAGNECNANDQDMTLV